MTKKKSVRKLSPKSPSIKKKNPQDSTLRNTRASNKRLDEIANDIKELKQRVTPDYNKQMLVKSVLEKSGLDSAETIKVYEQLNGIIWGS